MVPSTEGGVSMGSRRRTASWVLLAIAAGLTLFFSLVSSYRAYWGSYSIGRVPVAQVAAGREDVLTALRGIRGTSAAFGAAFAVMFLGTVLGPYRRGEGNQPAARWRRRALRQPDARHQGRHDQRHHQTCQNARSEGRNSHKSPFNLGVSRKPGRTFPL